MRPDSSAAVARLAAASPSSANSISSASRCSMRATRRRVSGLSSASRMRPWSCTLVSGSATVDPREHRDRLSAWEARVTAGGGTWRVINDLDRLDDLLDR